MAWGGRWGWGEMLGGGLPGVVVVHNVALMSPSRV
jgi:hypothetical protein